MKNIGSVIIVAVFTLALISCKRTMEDNNGQSEEGKIIADRVNTYLNNLEEESFSGTILVDYKGEKILSKGYGKSDVENNIDNQPNTIFDIGSVTKQFTAAGILKLEMLGELSVSDSISEYFPTIPTDKSSITIHHLLTHSSGLVDGVGDDYEEISEEDFINRVFNAPLISPVGEEYNYSNVGYSLLAIIIEKVSNSSYEAFLNEHLFVPSEMHHTGYTIPKWETTNIAVGYSKNNAWGRPNEKNWNSDAPYLNLKGNGGILSSSEDMYKWHLALIENKILDEKSKEKYYKPYIMEGENAPSYYAYGWAIFPTPRNTNLITHNGGNGIFFADFWRYLDEQVTVIVLTNKSNSYSDIIASQIAAVILTEDYNPILPDEFNESTIPEEFIQELAIQVFTTIRDGDKDSWSELITTKFSTDFKNMVPMETHLTFFNKFNKRLQEGEITSIQQEDDEILVSIKTKEEQFNMVFNIEPDENNELKIGGMMLD